MNSKGIMPLAAITARLAAVVRFGVPTCVECLRAGGLWVVTDVGNLDRSG